MQTKINFLLLILLVNTTNAFSQNVDSLYFQLDTASTVVSKNAARLDLANYYFYYHTDSARKYFKQFIAYNNNDLENARTISKIGICFAYDSRFDSALFYMEKARDIFIAENDSLEIAYSFNSIGLVNINTGQHEEGIKNLLESVRRKEKLQNEVPAEKLKIASTFMNIGIGFHTLEQYDKALEYYNKALEGAMAEKSERSEYNIKLQIANLHNDTENFNEALLLYQEIIDSKVFEKSAFALAKVYNNFASAFQGVKKFTEAENYFLKAYKINQQLGIENSACRNLNNLGNLNLEINKPTKAIEFSLQALELAKKTNDLYMQQSVYAVLSDAFEMNKNFRKSVEYHNLEDVVKDSINALEMRQTIADLESKYQLEQKQQTIKNLETENQLRESEIKRKNTVNLFTTAVLLIIVVALVFVILAFRKVRKQKVLLDKQKQELELLNDSLNKMFAIISHDLRNLIAGIKSSSELVNLFIEKDEKEKLTDQAQKLIGNTNRLETLLNNLLNWAISQGGLYKPQTEFLFIKKPIDDLIELSKPAAYDKNIELISHLNTDDQVLVDPDNFSFIFRNLLSNAIKFTQNGTVTFHAVADKKFTSIHVSDTGVGIPPEKLKNIFSLKKANKSLGTSGEKGTGLGLKLVHDFVKLNGGIIKIDSTPNKGTTVIVELPNC